MEIKPGLYERLIDDELQESLDQMSEHRVTKKKIDDNDGATILSKFVQERISHILQQMKDSGSTIEEQIKFVNAVMSQIQGTSAIVEGGFQLWEISSGQQVFLSAEKNVTDSIRPVTSLAQTNLFTGATEEPKLYEELKREIASADRIDFLVSFIKWGGFSLLAHALREFTQRGGILRVITTTYMGNTDAKVIDELSKLPNSEVKVSYDTLGTRLHAKSYIFHRETGYTTAYIGSSNLSAAALKDGLEWNIKITAQDLPDTMNRVKARFETYWNHKTFELYSESSKDRLRQALRKERKEESEDFQVMFDLHPYAFQQEILDQIEAERTVKGHFKNLVVAATGTGKTMVSAFDYKRFKVENKTYPTLLFVAHREEILKQSRRVFQTVLQDPNFGELWVGEYEPEEYKHLFVSVQTANSQQIDQYFEPEYFDYIVIDEFHHAAAETYQNILNHFAPKILLGLTATPERMDGKDIFGYFDDRIAAEIRLPEAINRNLLSPFQYYGVSDTVDLDTLTWARGGYQKGELTKLYSGNPYVAEQRAGHIIRTLDQYVADVDEVIGLGFCVTVEHAKFMADFFNKSSIPSMSLDSTTDRDTRNKAKQRLVSGELKFLFVVDLYNEGVDIPQVNTVMFLRPTESLTIFLQQLGRGLRISEGKEYLTVLDFIGLANRNYNFSEKFQALLQGDKDITKEIDHGFPSAPNGCYIYLEKKPQKVILENIKGFLKNRRGLVHKLKYFYDETGKTPTYENFLNYYHLKPQDIYKTSTFANLRKEAGFETEYSGQREQDYKKSLLRLSTINSRRWIQFLIKIIPSLETIRYDLLDQMEQRMFNMFYMTMWNKYFPSLSADDREKDLSTLQNNPEIIQEIIELLKFNYEKIDFTDQPVDIGFPSPLDLHCIYSRNQIMTVFDIEDPSTVREGVKYLADKKIDLLFVTLNKAEDDYLPTTMYNDYSINEYLFHWQSQSTTSEQSSTGQRYIHHANNGNKILLFVRDHKSVGSVTQPYTFLGLVDYASHEGSKPMNIIWQLEQPIPAKFIKITNKNEI